jgi:hypothetical protein
MKVTHREHFENCEIHIPPWAAVYSAYAPTRQKHNDFIYTDHPVNFRFNTYLRDVIALTSHCGTLCTSGEI